MKLTNRNSRHSQLRSRRTLAAGGVLAGIGAAASAIMVRRRRSGARERRRSS